MSSPATDPPQPAPATPAPPLRGARLVHQITAVIFLGAAVYTSITARDLGLYDSRGPGAGLFPFIVATGWAILSFIWFLQVTLGHSAEAPGPFLQKQGAIRVAWLAGAVVALAIVLPVLGFQIAIFAFVSSFLALYGRHHWVVTLAIAVGASFGLFTGFTQVLDVDLPVSSIPFLARLGF